MDFRCVAIGSGGLAAQAADALLVIVVGDKLPGSFPAADAPLLALLRDAIDEGDLELKAERCLYLHRPAGLKAARLLVAVAQDDAPASVKAAVAAALGQIKQLGIGHLALSMLGGVLDERYVGAVVSALADATYRYDYTKPSAAPASKLAKLSLLVEPEQRPAVQRALAPAQAIAAGVQLARECGNRPGNHCTPTWLGEQAKALAKRHGMKVQVFDREQIAKIGMGAFLAVAQGSQEPPRFIVLQYQGAPKSQAPVVLVGKGITFDSGGISIKPGAEMDEMKFDMCGAASVLGSFEAIGRLKPKLNLVGLIPSCDNMPSGSAVKPGDVVRSLSGKTIEILNTDAEGRLLLCDALTYAERFKPAAVIDIATLTGACVVALGDVHSGLFSPDDELADQLLQASRRALDTAWRMPMDDEYAEELKSNFADMANVGSRYGGAISAAKFLHKFTKDKYRWAHLDIAGTAWDGGRKKGATGRPVPLLVSFLLSRPH